MNVLHKFGCLSTALLLAAIPANAGVLRIVKANIPTLDCLIYGSVCSDQTMPPARQNVSFAVPGDTGSGVLRSEIRVPVPNAPLAGHTIFDYHLDMTQAVAGLPFNCLTYFLIDFGPITPLAYANMQGHPIIGDVFEAPSDASDTIALSSAEQMGTRVKFTFATPICPRRLGNIPAAKSYYFGLSTNTTVRNPPPPTVVSIGFVGLNRSGAVQVKTYTPPQRIILNNQPGSVTTP